MSIVQHWLMAMALTGQPAEAPAAEPPTGAPQAALNQFVADAKGYVITQPGPKPVQLELSAKPLLHWGNPARNGEDGAVFVWLKDGRPEVIGSVFEFPIRESKVRKHAFHSLSNEPLVAQLGEVEIWAPKKPGLTFSPVPGAEPPADNARRRLGQMRELSRQFSLELVDLKESKSELRLMTQPLLRYEPKAGPVQEGAIFAFAIGTDPEALLILESRQSADSFRWEYAFARFHFVTITARHDGKEVWNVAADREMYNTVFGRGDPQREKIYYSVMKSVTMP
jgi:hypothetical protein